MLNLEHLFAKQEELDQRIRKDKGLIGADLIDKKILALTVECSELINEVPEAMKFWSNKRMNRDQALAEYVDCLHFVLSLGIDKGYAPLRDHQVGANYQAGADHQVEEDHQWIGADSQTLRSEAGNGDLTVQFKHIFAEIQAFSQNQDINHYVRLVRSFIALGWALGFSWTEIEQAYFEKNEVNHQRQAQGY